MKAALMILIIGLMFTLAFPYIQSVTEGAGDETLTALNYTKVADDGWDTQTDFLQGLFGLITIVLAVLMAMSEQQVQQHRMG